MSDFDKEAEREKLREKFERDRKKRESTQRMSELLLKGATMTNRHCDTCGDPLFRHDGREFCATCNGTDRAEADADDEQTGESRAGTGESRTTEQPSGTQAPDGRVNDGALDERSTEGRADAARPTDGRTERDGVERSAEADVATGESRVDASPSSTAGAAAGVESAARGASDAPPVTAGDLGEARESLIRTITKYSRAAERTDDPRRAKELLAAAREAAETLSALS